MRTSNPALNDKVFKRSLASQSESMSIQGTVNKSVILLGISVITAIYTWNLFNAENYQALIPYLLVGSIGGFIVALVIILL